MRRLKSFAALAAALILIMPARAHAEPESGKMQQQAKTAIKLTYERAKAFAKLNSVTIKKLARNEREFFKKYDSYLKEAETIDPFGVTYSFGGKEYYLHYDLETQLMMKKTKELYPEQMKLVWENARDSCEVAENSMEIYLREIYLGAYNARSDWLLKQKQLELASMVNRQDRIRLERGLISPLYMEESEYNVLKAQKEAAEAERNYENMARNLNQFMGLPPETRFSDIMAEEGTARTVLEPVEHYIGEALKNRHEIKQVEKQIALKEQEKSIIESSYLYKINTDAQKEYELLLIELEKLGMDLEEAKLSIENEIRNAYADIIKTGKSIENVKKAVELQKSAYEKMKAKYDAGQVAENILRQAEINLEYARNSYTVALFDYKTRIMRFEYAAGIGPAY